MSNISKISFIEEIKICVQAIEACGYNQCLIDRVGGSNEQLQINLENGRVELTAENLDIVREFFIPTDSVYPRIELLNSGYVKYHISKTETSIIREKYIFILLKTFKLFVE